MVKLSLLFSSLFADGKMGDILSTILDAGFEISAIQSFTLNRVMAEEFLEVYNGGTINCAFLFCSDLSFLITSLFCSLL